MFVAFVFLAAHVHAKLISTFILKSNHILQTKELRELAFLKRVRNLAIIAVLVIIIVGAYVGYTMVISPKGEEKIIKIGLITELSGFHASTGLALLPAFELIEQYINERLGVMVGGERYNISLIVRDSRSDVTAAMSYATELIEEEGCLMLTGTSSSDQGIALRAYAEKNKIPYLTTMVSSPAVNEPPTDWTYRIQPDAVSVGAAEAMWALEQNPNAKIAIMYADNSFSGAIAFGAKYYIENYANPEQLIYFQGFPVQQADFTAASAYVKTLGVDFVLSYHFSANMVQSLLAAGFTTNQVISYFMANLSSKRAIVWTEENILGAVSFLCTDHWYAVSNDDPERAALYAWFWPEYKKSYGEIPSEEGLYALDSIFLIRDAIQRANSLDRTKINEQLQASVYNSFSYPGQSIRFDENGGLMLDKYPISRVVEVFNATCSRDEVIALMELPELPCYELATSYPVYPY
ncbi:MAG: ABC transporter substrate-binding protein [Promethearchaeota archaeon]